MRGIKLLVGGRAWPPALVRLDPSSLVESGEDRSLRLPAEATAEVLTDDCPGGGLALGACRGPTTAPSRSKRRQAHPWKRLRA